MSHQLATPQLLSAVSIAHAQNCVPIAPDANGGRGRKAKKSQVI
jgi:hypothetical protein